MAGLQPALQFLSIAQQGAGLVSNVLSTRDREDSQKQALRELQGRQREQERQLAEDANLQRATLAANAQESERRRREALRRAVSRQRAQFGTQGIGSTGGSAQAVLLGLFDESEQERAERERLDALRLAAIDQGIEQQRRLNVLQLTQLKQKQKIGSLSSQASDFGNSLGSGLNFLGSTVF